MLRQQRVVNAMDLRIVDPQGERTSDSLTFRWRNRRAGTGCGADDGHLRLDVEDHREQRKEGVGDEGVEPVVRRPVARVTDARCGERVIAHMNGMMWHSGDTNIVEIADHQEHQTPRPSTIRPSAAG